MLPDADGFQICRKIREKSYFPIILLKAKTADVVRLWGCPSELTITLQNRLIRLK